MKSILYVGATLMIGASIYGFADYKQTKEKKKFKSMYTEKKDKPTSADQQYKMSAGDVKNIDEINETPVLKKNDTRMKKKRKFSIKEFSRAPLRDDIVGDAELPEK